MNTSEFRNTAPILTKFFDERGFLKIKPIETSENEMSRAYEPAISDISETTLPGEDDPILPSMDPKDDLPELSDTDLNFFQEIDYWQPNSCLSLDELISSMQDTDNELA